MASCKRKTWILLAIIATLCTISLFAFSKFYDNHRTLPLGCDVFGYLNMARAIDAGRLFRNHSQRPFDPELTGFLQNSHHPFKHYAWMIAPHAYHLNPKVMRVINQYPPGTSLLLALIPIEYRGILFASMCLALLTITVMIACALCGGISSYSIMVLSCLGGAICLLSPFREELTKISSVAPTFGLLIACGYLLRKKPSYSILLLGTSTLFRIANVILFLPLLFVYLLSAEWKERCIRAILIRTWKAFLLLLAGGLGVYFVYLWILLGNPFSFTYSPIDQKICLFDQFYDHLFFYFNWRQGWFKVHVLFNIMTLITVCISRRRDLIKWFVFSLILSVFNYSFYLFHEVMIQYYPYASAMITIGLFLNILGEKFSHQTYKRVFAFCSIVILITYCYSGVKNFPDINIKKEFYQQVSLYQDAFRKYDVIWGEIRTGTLEYSSGCTDTDIPKPSSAKISLNLTRREEKILSKKLRV